MMKKWFLGFGLAALLLAGVMGTALAASDNGNWTFEDMLPFMKSMHPDLTDEQLQTMFNACHGNNGAGGMMNGNNDIE